MTEKNQVQINFWNCIFECQ